MPQDENHEPSGQVEKIRVSGRGAWPSPVGLSLKLEEGGAMNPGLGAQPEGALPGSTLGKLADFTASLVTDCTAWVTTAAMGPSALEKVISSDR